jgi:hypothetical protein
MKIGRIRRPYQDVQIEDTKGHEDYCYSDPDERWAHVLRFRRESQEGSHITTHTQYVEDLGPEPVGDFEYSFLSYSERGWEARNGTMRWHAATSSLEFEAHSLVFMTVVRADVEKIYYNYPHAKIFIQRKAGALGKGYDWMIILKMAGVQETLAKLRGDLEKRFRGMVVTKKQE